MNADARMGDDGSAEIRSTPPQRAAGAAGVSERDIARLRWRCRRGLLENDLILSGFLDAQAQSLTEVDVAALNRLLEAPDNELWDMLSGRMEPPDESLRPILKQLRKY